MTDPSFLPNIEATIVNGRFVVNPGMWISVLHEDIAVVHFDCKSKYPCILSASAAELTLVPGEGSLHLDETTDEYYTRIQIKMPPTWRIRMFETGRYTVSVVIGSDDMEPIYKETN